MQTIETSGVSLSLRDSLKREVQPSFYETFMLLAEHIGAVVSVQEYNDKLFPRYQHFGVENNFRTDVSNIRKGLDECNSNLAVYAVWGKGYILMDNLGENALFPRQVSSAVTNLEIPESLRRVFDNGADLTKVNKWVLKPRLTEKEYVLLMCLAENFGNLVNFYQLRSSMWSEELLERPRHAKGVLTLYIGMLRKKLVKLGGSDLEIISKKNASYGLQNRRDLHLLSELNTNESRKD